MLKNRVFNGELVRNCDLLAHAQGTILNYAPRSENIIHYMMQVHQKKDRLQRLQLKNGTEMRTNFKINLLSPSGFRGSSVMLAINILWVRLSKISTGSYTCKFTVIPVN